MSVSSSGLPGRTKPHPVRMFALLVRSKAANSTRKASTQKNMMVCSEFTKTCKATLPITTPSARPVINAVLGHEATQVAGWSQLLMRYDPSAHSTRSRYRKPVVCSTPAATDDGPSTPTASNPSPAKGNPIW